MPPTFGPARVCRLTGDRDVGLDLHGRGKLPFVRMGTPSGKRRSRGARLLTDFVERNGLSRRATADALGTSKTSVIFWMRGSLRPRHAFRLAIEKWTNGEVPAGAWEDGTERSVVAAVQPFRASRSEAA